MAVAFWASWPGSPSLSCCGLRIGTSGTSPRPREPGPLRAGLRHRARRPRLLAYTFEPALGQTEKLSSADAEGRRRLGEALANGP